MQNIKLIREQCKAIKKEKGFTNQFLAAETKVSKSTVDRFFSNQECGFQYETIQPLVKFLIEFNKPVEETDVPIPNDNLIELYKSIINEKQKMIDSKDAAINYLKDQAQDMWKSRNLFRTAFIISIIVLLMVVYLLIDSTVGSFGLIRY